MASCSDGFPPHDFPGRCPAGFVTLDAVVNIDVDLDRLASRITAAASAGSAARPIMSAPFPGKTQHAPNATVPFISVTMIRIETVMNRLKVYEAQTKPLIEYYEAKGCLVTVDGSQSIDEVTAAIYAALEQRV